MWLQHFTLGRPRTTSVAHATEGLSQISVCGGCSGKWELVSSYCRQGGRKDSQRLSCLLKLQPQHRVLDPTLLSQPAKRVLSAADPQPRKTEEPHLPDFCHTLDKEAHKQLKKELRKAVSSLLCVHPRRKTRS